MRHLVTILALSLLALAAPAAGQVIIPSGQAVVFFPGTGSQSAAIDANGNLTIVSPPRPGGPFVYNPREQTVTGVGFQSITIPGFTGGPLINPVYALGF